jgi:hypothetical protein
MTFNAINYGTPAGSVPLTSYEREDKPVVPPKVLSAEEILAQQNARWMNLSEALRQQLQQDRDGLRVASLEKELAALTASGFVYIPPVIEKPTKAPVEKIVAFTHFADKEICEVCAEHVPIGCASHNRDLDGETCIRNARRVRLSGRYDKERLAELVELSATIKTNRQ